jgi:hypothetical protein
MSGATYSTILILNYLRVRRFIKVRNATGCHTAQPKNEWATVSRLGWKAELAAKVCSVDISNMSKFLFGAQNLWALTGKILRASYPPAMRGHLR